MAEPSTPRQRARLVARLDKLIASGRVTPSEAIELRAADGPDAFDAVVHQIRTRHASARLDEAVASGAMTGTDADAYRERLERGEHPRGLRSHLGRLRHRTR